MAKDDTPARSPYINATLHKGWLAAAGAVIVLFLAFGVGMAAGRFSDPHTFERGISSRNVMMGGGGMFGHHEGGFLSSNQNRVVGTVTAVNGANFTVAGQGSTEEVTTNSSTQYHGGSSVKVNDTVMAMGTTDNGVLTATRIVVNP